MTIFDSLFFHFFNHYKKKQHKKANNIASFYLTLLQASLLLLLGVFFAVFFKQMHVNTMSANKAWTLFALVVTFLMFKNWMQYSGRKRKVLNVKMLKKKKLDYSIWLLWFLPFGFFALAYLIALAG